MHTFVSKDGAMRFRYPDPWFVDDNSADSISLFNYKLTPEEEAGRGEDYSFHDGEGKIEIYVGQRVNLAGAKKEECRTGESTFKIHECLTTRIDGREALWILMDAGNDTDCRCRLMLLNGKAASYTLRGGSCIDCSQSGRLLSEVENIFRSVDLK